PARASRRRRRAIRGVAPRRRRVRRGADPVVRQAPAGGGRAGRLAGGGPPPGLLSADQLRGLPAPRPAALPPPRASRRLFDPCDRPVPEPGGPVPCHEPSV